MTVAGSRETTTIVSRARDVAGLFEAPEPLADGAGDGGGGDRRRTAPRSTRRSTGSWPRSADTYPAFELRGLDWEEICERRHATRSGAPRTPLAACQAWLAELEDSHTWVWPGHGNLPYVLRVVLDDRSRSRTCRRGRPGYAAGVRPGWRLVELDGESPDGRGWLARTAAPAHSRPSLAGRRLLAGPPGVAARPRPPPARQDADVVLGGGAALGPPEPVVSWRRLASGARLPPDRRLARRAATTRSTPRSTSSAAARR